LRTALITDGSGGIGKACGRGLAEAGYDVMLTARREAPLRAPGSSSRLPAPWRSTAARTPGPVETDMLQDVPFEMHAIRAADVAETVAWLDTVDSSVDLPEIRLNAITRGPSARKPVVPNEVERRRAADGS
jgi:NADP-dependent 3-hydroxy acid dehydrogenase YdfG